MSTARTGLPHVGHEGIVSTPVVCAAFADRSKLVRTPPEAAAANPCRGSLGGTSGQTSETRQKDVLWRVTTRCVPGARVRSGEAWRTWRAHLPWLRIRCPRPAPWARALRWAGVRPGARPGRGGKRGGAWRARITVPSMDEDIDQMVRISQVPRRSTYTLMRVCTCPPALFGVPGVVKGDIRRRPWSLQLWVRAASQATQLSVGVASAGSSP